MSTHARVSPSALKRIMNCPPSLRLSEQFSDEGSPYAAEGTAGHALAEHLIKKYLKQRTKRPVSDYFSDELLEAVEDYVSFVIGEIETARKECENPVLAVELKVDISAYVEECFGTADMVIVTDKTLHIIDLKLGKGVQVDAEDNPQLMAYGLGVLDLLGMIYEPETVQLTIYQPRINHYSTWDILPEDLERWGNEQLKAKAALALAGEGAFSVGSWCRFCKAKSQCRARADEFLKLAQMEFRPPALLSDSEIADILAVSDELAKWASDVYAYAQDEAVAHGREWPGYKLVEGRTNRKYTSEEDVVQAASKAGYTDIYKRTLIGITEMQRLMGKKEFDRILGKLVYKPQGKITLVPESDKREAIIKATAEADFKEE